MSDPARGLALDCVAHLLSPWGPPVRDLDELHQRLADAPATVLFAHIVQGQLRHASAETPPADDISAWVAAALHDHETAERMSFAVQPPFAGAEASRERLLGILGGLGEKRRRERRSPEGGGLTLLAATSVRFPTGVEVTELRDLDEAFQQVGVATWFLYLLEEPWFRHGGSILVDWVELAGDARLAAELRGMAGCDLPLARGCEKLRRRLRMRHLAGRVARAAASPEHVRRASAHDAVVRLARRASDSDPPS